MAENDLELLARFAREHSQDAFTALVERNLGLVYSAALRQVRSPHLAEEIAQSVFTSLARNAAKLTSDTILAAWLYRATRNAAIDVIRAESRRQAREQISLQMSATNDSPANWSHVEPLLDEAMDSLEEPDRAALLLRYFENKSLRDVGIALGTNDDAAQKRVSRAVDRLRDFFSTRNVVLGATGLAALLSANAIQAVPVGLVTTVATGAVLATTALSAAATVTATATATAAIVMTTAQKITVAVLLTAAVGAGIYEGLQASQLRSRVQTLERQQQQHQQQVDAITHERDEASAQLAKLSEETVALKNRPTDVLKLRNQVGQLKRENTEIGSKSALSKVTADPATRQMMRDQQKMGMTMIYGKFIKDAKLTPEQKEKFSDLLADHVMDNIDQITLTLRDKPAKDQMNQSFAAQEAALSQKVVDLLGPEAAAQFKNYSSDIGSMLTAEQFKEKLSGTDAEKNAKTQQILHAMQGEMTAALAEAHLPADYQTVPMLNFVNIADEQQGDQSLKFLENVYDHLTAQTSSFLNAEEQKKFTSFTAEVIKNNRMALKINRSMMAPIAQ